MNIKIIHKKKINLPDVPDGQGWILNRFYYEIQLSDKSKWVCDCNGENWKRVNQFSVEKEATNDDLLNNFLKSRKNVG